MSADARVARAIIEVRDQLVRHPVHDEVQEAIADLIDEAMCALHLADDDIEEYR